MDDRYADLREGLESFKRAVGELRGPEAQVAVLLADYDRMREAVQETVRVIESNPSSITDTIWVTGGLPETLLDRCRAALAQEGP